MAEAHRITISIPEDLDEQIRQIQGEIVAKEARNCSFQETLFILLQRGLDAQPIKN